MTDALELPIRFILTEGQAADISQAIPLMAGIATSALLADKGYDANPLLAWLKERQIQAVIPRYEKRASHFKGMLAFAAVLLWLH
ncbi:transposase [Azotobacter salinestris]|uniref:transposase n=1 Tax=Azotobacter salinestris TaxID=69964 RepID=UPI00142EFCDD|nr:transposase [Azotobacter salinestris]